MLASKLTLANISQLKAKYCNIFHMLCSNVSFVLRPNVVVGADHLFTLADSISKLMLGSVARCLCCIGEMKRRYCALMSV